MVIHKDINYSTYIEARATKGCGWSERNATTFGVVYLLYCIGGHTLVLCPGGEFVGLFLIGREMFIPSPPQTNPLTTPLVIMAQTLCSSPFGKCQQKQQQQHTNWQGWRNVVLRISCRNGMERTRGPELETRICSVIAFSVPPPQNVQCLLLNTEQPFMFRICSNSIYLFIDTTITTR